MVVFFPFLLAYAAVVAASPLAVMPRAVTSLNEAATAEAQQRDDTATRAFSNVQIKTASGRCLFVDKLSGDFRENLTPIQVAACGSTDGQGWDVITKGKHNDRANSMLIVSTLTQACANFDPRRAAGNQVLLFSCGGRADGGGQVTDSQLFAFNGGAGPLAIAPENQAGSCFTVKGNVVDIAACNAADPNQSFTFGNAVAGGNAAGGSAVGGGNAVGGGAVGAGAAGGNAGNGNVAGGNAAGGNVAGGAADGNISDGNAAPPAGGNATGGNANNGGAAGGNAQGENAAGAGGATGNAAGGNDGEGIANANGGNANAGGSGYNNGGNANGGNGKGKKNHRHRKPKHRNGQGARAGGRAGN